MHLHFDDRNLPYLRNNRRHWVTGCRSKWCCANVRQGIFASCSIHLGHSATEIVQVFFLIVSIFKVLSIYQSFSIWAVVVPTVNVGTTHWNHRGYIWNVRGAASVVFEPSHAIVQIVWIDNSSLGSKRLGLIQWTEVSRCCSIENGWGTAKFQTWATCQNNRIVWASEAVDCFVDENYFIDVVQTIAIVTWQRVVTGMDPLNKTSKNKEWKDQFERQ